MRQHTVEEIKVEELSDEYVAHTLRCCGDPTTDSVHSFSVHAEDVEAKLEAAKQGVAARHEAKLAWRLRRAGAPVKEGSKMPR